MVIICNIQSIRSALCIYLDDGERYWIHKDDLKYADFQPGITYNKENFLQQISVLQYPRALNLAVSMLAKRPCSENEIRQKLLRRKFIPDVTELVIYKLKKEHLLNDHDFCEQWVRYRTGCKYGPRVIRTELRMKGISDDIILSVLEKLDEEDNFNNALSLSFKYWKKKKPDEDIQKSRRRVISALVRKGYDWSTAQKACDMAESEIKNNCME